MSEVLASAKAVKTADAANLCSRLTRTARHRIASSSLGSSFIWSALWFAKHSAHLRSFIEARYENRPSWGPDGPGHDSSLYKNFICSNPMTNYQTALSELVVQLTITTCSSVTLLQIAADLHALCASSWSQLQVCLLLSACVSALSQPLLWYNTSDMHMKPRYACQHVLQSYPHTYTLNSDFEAPAGQTVTKIRNRLPSFSLAMDHSDIAKHWGQQTTYLIANTNRCDTSAASQSLETLHVHNNHILHTGTRTQPHLQLF